MSTDNSEPNAQCRMPSASTLSEPSASPSQRLKRLRVLISAYACEPGRGSEPGVGWNMATSLARHHDVWVITRANNRELIENEMRRCPLEGIQFIYFDLPKWAMWWKKGGRGVQIYYYLWQLGLLRVAKKSHRQIGFDAAHHLTFGKYWVPSMLSFLPIPFVWGPVGGGESMPRAFWKELSAKELMYELGRSFARKLGELHFLVRKTAKKCSVAIATTGETASRLEKIGCRNISELPQCALSEKQINLLLAPNKNPKHKGVRFLSIGRAFHWKGFGLGLRAFAQAAIPDSEYWMLVNGPGRASLESLAKNLGIASQVRFIDPVSGLEEVYSLMKACDVLVHPALHEAFGNVVQEFLAAKGPVICLDIGGPATQVKDEFGFRASARDPLTAIAAVKNAMRQLAEHPEHRTELGLAGSSYVTENMRWGNLAERMASFYCQAVQRSHIEQ